MIINNKNLDLFVADLENAVKEIETKYQIKLTTTNIKYDDNEFTISLKARNVTSDGISVETQRALDTLSWFKLIYNKKFRHGTHTFTVVGYEYGVKYPLLCKRDDNRVYKFSSSIVTEKEFI